MCKDRHKIENLLVEYEELLAAIVDGYASIKQQENMRSILNELSFYTTRAMISPSKCIEG